MSDEEKKAIEIVKDIAKNAVEYDYLNWDDIEAIKVLLTVYEKEKEKNKKAIKYCKEKSTFQTFEDFELQNVLETYINRLKHRILDILEE